jgi:hypothetical protein
LGKSLSSNEKLKSQNGKDMNVKPLYNSVNLPYLLFKSPKRRRNKSRTKWVSKPNEEGQ